MLFSLQCRDFDPLPTSLISPISSQFPVAIYAFAKYLNTYAHIQTHTWGEKLFETSTYLKIIIPLCEIGSAPLYLENSYLLSKDLLNHHHHLLNGVFPHSPQTQLLFFVTCKLYLHIIL